LAPAAESAPSPKSRAILLGKCSQLRIEEGIIEASARAESAGSYSAAAAF
jgi:hypothetical protein